MDRGSPALTMLVGLVRLGWYLHVLVSYEYHNIRVALTYVIQLINQLINFEDFILNN